MKVLLSLIAILILSTPSWAQRIKLNEALRTELNGLLKATSKLHEACVDQDNQQVATSVKQVIAKIERANKKSVLAEDQQTHLVKMLNAAKENLRMSQEMSGKKRRGQLKDAFFQLVQLAQTYKLDKYPIYFCSKDRSIWIQKSWGKPRNPINPKSYKKCGQLVR